MKKLFIISSVSFSLGLLLVCGIAYANQTNMSTYYPSPSGTYTKVHLINQSGGPNENSVSAPFCQWTSANGATTALIGSGATFINAGTIFTDSTTGYLEICKSDGTVATYPGSCFNRFGTVVANPPCPTNYHQSGGSSSMSNNAVSWTCCFTGGLTTTATQSGCFSLYSTTSPAPYCSTVNSNAYDIGCAYVGSFYKRDCCYNDSAGSLTPTSCGSCVPVNGSCTACSSTCQNIAGTCTASTQPTCGGSSAVETTCYGSTPTTNGSCTSWGACTVYCPPSGVIFVDGTYEPCQANSNVNDVWCGVSGTQTCLSTSPAQCGGNPPSLTQSCSGNEPINGSCNSWGACSTACGSGTETCLSSNPPLCGGSAAPTTQSCTGISCGSPGGGPGGPSGPPNPPPCTPTTCAAQGKNCGVISDGCGGTNFCGNCITPKTCGGGGSANVCGASGNGGGSTDSCNNSCSGGQTCCNGTCEPNGGTCCTDNANGNYWCDNTTGGCCGSGVCAPANGSCCECSDGTEFTCSGSTPTCSGCTLSNGISGGECVSGDVLQKGTQCGDSGC